ncbi:uncharacterized protein LOC141922116 isoform X2 [Strix aluco]|uniref:uncharacterized protein LOC141922116 isoform X2 n=1 Tax=Strix aluco TaxID=111821 RepID=UPI003DA1E3E0
MAAGGARLLAAETVLRPRWSVPVLGMLFTAPTSGLCGVSLPGLVLLTARGQKGTGGALPGCGPWPGAAAAEAGEARERERRRKSRLCGQHPPPSAGRESLPLWVRKEPSSQSAAGQAASVHPGSACVTPSAGEDSQATGFSEEEEGQEEGRRKKHLTRQILPAVPRARAAGMVGPDDLQEFPSHLKPFCSSGVTTVTSRAVSYHRREKVAPGFKAIPSACCFTPAAALLKKRRRKLWLTKLCHNRDCSRQHHGMLIMTSTGLAVLSFSLLLAMDLQWPLIRGKRLYNSKWSYKAVLLAIGVCEGALALKRCLTHTAYISEEPQEMKYCSPAGGGEERRDKHGVRKDPQGKREWQEEWRKSRQQVEEREGCSGQSSTVRGGAAT